MARSVPSFDGSSERSKSGDGLALLRDRCYPTAGGKNGGGRSKLRVCALSARSSNSIRLCQVRFYQPFLPETALWPQYAQRFVTIAFWNVCHDRAQAESSRQSLVPGI